LRGKEYGKIMQEGNATVLQVASHRGQHFKKRQSAADAEVLADKKEDHPRRSSGRREKVKRKKKNKKKKKSLLMIRTKNSNKNREKTKNPSTPHTPTEKKKPQTYINRN